MNFAIVSGENARFCNVSFPLAGESLESKLAKDNDSYGLWVRFLFELNPAYQRQFVAMEDLRVSVTDLEAILPMVREHGLALIRAYEADPRIAKGKTIVVLGYAIVVNDTPYWGKGSKLDHFQRFLLFLTQAIEARVEVYIYFYENLNVAERSILGCLEAQPSGLRIGEIINSTRLSWEDTKDCIDRMIQLHLVVVHQDGESYSATQKGLIAYTW